MVPLLFTRSMTASFLIVASCFLLQFSHSAVLKTSSRESESYDQKQTGDYNIRLHLKDFQIIALLSEEALNALGDDYEDLDYHIPEEYLDVPLSTTQSNQDSVSSTSIQTTTEPSMVERIKTTAATTLSTTTATSPPRRTVTSRVTTKKPEIITKTTPSTTLSTLSTTIKENVSNKSVTTAIPFREDADKIPVIIMQEKSNKNANNSTKKVVSTSVTILPSSEDSGHAGSVSQVMLGEILQYKRCPDGYSRDKMGRCRKTRRPQLPFDITRFTSSLATRFKRPITLTSTAKSES